MAVCGGLQWFDMVYWPHWSALKWRMEKSTERRTFWGSIWVNWRSTGYESKSEKKTGEYFGIAGIDGCSSTYPPVTSNVAFLTIHHPYFAEKTQRAKAPFSPGITQPCLIAGHKSIFQSYPILYSYISYICIHIYIYIYNYIYIFIIIYIHI
jgi:hypothetical protein